MRHMSIHTVALQNGHINFEAFKWHQELQGNPERYITLPLSQLISIMYNSISNI